MHPFASGMPQILVSFYALWVDKKGDGETLDVSDKLCCSLSSLIMNIRKYPPKHAIKLFLHLHGKYLVASLLIVVYTQFYTWGGTEKNISLNSERNSEIDFCVAALTHRSCCISLNFPELCNALFFIETILNWIMFQNFSTLIIMSLNLFCQGSVVPLETSSIFNPLSKGYLTFPHASKTIMPFLLDNFRKLTSSAALIALTSLAALIPWCHQYPVAKAKKHYLRLSFCSSTIFICVFNR